jgi:3-hydroxybutyryl-CoA dehydratase
MLSMSQLTGYFLEDLSVGQSASFAKVITEADILAYSHVSGDKNPVHLDHDYASSTMFKGRIAHGMLTAGLISAVIGTKLPGPGAIYVSQSLAFKAPVRIDDHVTATVTIAEIVGERRRIRLNCDCAVDGNIVLEGEAIIMVPRRPALT